MENGFESKYRQILLDYLKHQDEEILYSCDKLTKEALEDMIPPEEIVNMHRAILEEYDPEMADYVRQSFDVLLETMVGYGLAYLEHLSLRTEQKALKSEIAQAETMQKTLMKSDLPKREHLSFGVVSVAARQMSGDYYSFTEEDSAIGVALADVIGKGIPAAFSISMIKYALAGLIGEEREPSNVLKTLNEIAEENINDNMFITMFYGLYHEDTHIFEYGSAGHEVGLYYQAAEGIFSDLYARGLPLGVDKNAPYRRFEKHVQKEDIIFIMSDGVTESRTEGGFIERDELTALFARYLSLETQEMVEEIYNQLLKMQNFILRDDFTLICIKRTA
ncbi:PP2C family protein-serine/threonine phosphatase [Listeria costaricensis]|uniref:PP2C family protein-serine/threonine phosphatase n=1 Tax=Listeria costaricensis TaxID=2026604 RepID=UPI000C06FD8D|nr:PP2C family protein-serine/threonine phosphatase [Listeria costaricensis]